MVDSEILLGFVTRDKLRLALGTCWCELSLLAFAKVLSQAH